MNVTAVIKYFVITAFFMAGCSATTVTTAVNNGATPLDVDEIYNLVINNTLHLVSPNFDAHIFYAENGSLAAKSLLNADDRGKWDIKSDSSLCLKFHFWYYGDVKCYSVYREAESSNYLFFSNNGAFAFTANVIEGDSEQLYTRGKQRKKDTYMRSSLNQKNNNASSGTISTGSTTQTTTPTWVEDPEPVAEHADTEQSIREMAKDCPGCNLSGADLRQANLVGANLKAANLTGAKLSGANLRRANLEGANLTGATLISANLPGANFKNANLQGVDLTGSNLIHTDLTGANLTNAILLKTLQEETKGL